MPRRTNQGDLSLRYFSSLLNGLRGQLQAPSGAISTTTQAKRSSHILVVREFLLAAFFDLANSASWKPFFS